MNRTGRVRESSPERPMGRYRVIELPGLIPLLAGKSFADLGADVVKIEPPGGDRARQLGPLVEGRTDPEASLLWASCSVGKRSVTLDVGTAGGKQVLFSLLASADVLLEGFPPGAMDAMGLSIAELRAAFPKLVITSISPFGQDGPYAQYHGSDLVHFAMGGYLNMTGDPGRPPIKPSAPYQSFFHAAMHATMATLLALRHRDRQGGSGVHIDQSIRDTGVWMLTHTYQHFDMLGIDLGRQGASRDMGGTAVRLPSVYRTADGYVVWLFLTGHVGGPSVGALVKWMDSQGMAPDWMREIDWQTLDLIAAGPEFTTQLHQTFSAFLAEKRNSELLAFALRSRLMLAPVRTISDVLDDDQMAARNSWRSINIGESQVRIPGPAVRLSDATWEPRATPATPGQHNLELYQGELHMEEDDIRWLHQSGVI